MASEQTTNVLLFGLGAIGGFYAFILGQNPNVSLSVVARSNYEAIKENGLELRSENHGKQQVNISNVLKSPSHLGIQFDYVVCAHKAINPDSIPPLFTSCVTAKTTFVIIQNGVGNEEPFRNTFPDNTIISCVTWTGAVQKTPGIITHNSNEDMQIGLFPNSKLDPNLEDKRLKTFADYLTTGGTKFTIEENIQIKRWEKVVWNAAWNPLTTLTGLQVQTFLSTTSEALTFTRQLMEDVITVGRKCGVPLKDGLTEELIQKVKGMPLIYSSMYVDSKAGRPLETDVIVGFPMKKAREFELEVPALRAVFALTIAVNHRLTEESERSLPQL